MEACVVVRVGQSSNQYRQSSCEHGKAQAAARFKLARTSGCARLWRAAAAAVQGGARVYVMERCRHHRMRTRGACHRPSVAGLAAEASNGSSNGMAGLSLPPFGARVAAARTKGINGSKAWMGRLRSACAIPGHGQVKSGSIGGCVVCVAADVRHIPSAHLVWVCLNFVP